MVINQSLEDIRVFSQMSERCHFVEIDGKHYTCINGIALPYNLAVVILLTIMAKSDSARFLELPIIKDEILSLNPNNEELKNKDYMLLSYIDTTIRNAIKTWDSKMLIDLIPHSLSKLGDLS